MRKITLNNHTLNIVALHDAQLTCTCGWSFVRTGYVDRDKAVEMWKKHLNGKKAKVRLLIGWYTVRLLVQYDLDGKRYTIDGLGYSGGLFLKQYGWEWVKGFKCPGVWVTKNKYECIRVFNLINKHKQYS